MEPKKDLWRSGEWSRNYSKFEEAASIMADALLDEPVVVKHG